MMLLSSLIPVPLPAISTPTGTSDLLEVLKFWMVKPLMVRWFTGAAAPTLKHPWVVQQRKPLPERKPGVGQQPTPVLPSTIATPCPSNTMGAEAVPELVNATLSL